MPAAARLHWRIKVVFRLCAAVQEGFVRREERRSLVLEEAGGIPVVPLRSIRIGRIDIPIAWHPRARYFAVA
ncbi:hypothetical protein NG819_18745 [Pseudarthrobacter sp. Fe7]|nr:hypothetical protein NG819_18745 [Pseudarthrobacter sp. Fe7]